ncbi:MAG: hypothetical protein ACTSWY_04780 [Promethearchaeota archaeon]
MKQINFRLTEDEYEIVDNISKILDKSIPSLLKEIGMKEIEKICPKLALNLYRNNKIGLKKAWKLSRLTFFEFIQLLIENNIEPNIPDELDEKMVDLAQNLKISDIFPGKSVEELRKTLYGVNEGD